MAFAREQMSEKLNHDPGLCKALIPDWELGCRRVTPGAGYLESFLQPNVHLTQSPIQKITENSIITADGQETPVDVGKSTSHHSTAIPKNPRTELLILDTSSSNLRHRLRRIPRAPLPGSRPQRHLPLLEMG